MISEQNERRKANVLWTNVAVYKSSLKYLLPVESLKSLYLTNDLIHCRELCLKALKMPSLKTLEVFVEEAAPQVYEGLCGTY